VAFDGNDFVPDYGGLASRGDSRVWKCISHEGFEVKVKVVHGGDSYNLFRSMDEHGEVRAQLPRNFKGISAEFDAPVKELVSLGLPPNRIYSELIVQCGDDEDKKGRIPAKTKIAARRNGLIRSPEFQFSTFADMQAWAEDKLVATKEEFDAVTNLDQLLVFSIFHEDIRIEDESGGAEDGAMIDSSTFGFIYGSKRTMGQLRDVSRYVTHFALFVPVRTCTSMKMKWARCQIVLTLCSSGR
jgi:hypothetical protein